MNETQRGEIVQDNKFEENKFEENKVEEETVTAPAKVMRIGSMIKQLLDEVRSMTLDSPSRERLAEIYERSIVELTTALSPDLQELGHKRTPEPCSCRDHSIVRSLQENSRLSSLGRASQQKTTGRP